MVQIFKRFCWAWLALGTVQSASAFSLVGEFDDWQVEQLGYRVGDGLALIPTGDDLGFLVDAPLGGPMNLGEEFRRNIDTITYAFDASFLDYFGSNGVYAVEQAIQIMNSLTNVSSYTNLDSVPLEATRMNHRAGALGLLDLKSVALHLLVEQLGLADPVRYLWTLRARALPPGAQCPAYTYLVIKRNFDPVTWEPSSYVNGNLYSYRIREFCPDPDRADAVEFLVDPTAGIFYKAVASPGVFDGSFFTGLTRDDIGGLRYLIRSNNVNFEDVPFNSTLIAGGFTNTAARQLLFTSNLTVFASQALTNGPAALNALYPDLVITGTTPIFTNVVTSNAFGYFTNFPWSPAGSPASLVLATNRTTNVVTWFQHSFANLVVNSFPNGRLSILQTNVGFNCAWVPAGTLCTNVTLRNILTNMVMGDFYIVPTNLCDFRVVSTQLVDVVASTNLDFVATNAVGTTNGAGQEFSQSTITYFTNRVLVVDPIECGTNAALRQGIEKIRFVRRDYDSLFGQFFHPFTNRFNLTMVTNNTAIVQTFERIVDTPDILFRADDLVTDPTAFPIGVGSTTRNINFNVNNVLPALPGPGVIEPVTTITFEKVGPAFFNASPSFLDEATGVPFFVWGSFDGSTNTPTIYPSGSSIVELENSVFINVQREVEFINRQTGANWLEFPTGVVLEPGALNQPYPQPKPPLPQTHPVRVSFTASGGQAPYTWSALPPEHFPPGLSLVPDPTDSARSTLSGVPTMTGHFDFVLRMMDSHGRYVDRILTLTITP